MKSQRSRSGDSGFTLVELMVVVVILGILIMIAVASFAYSSRVAAKTTCEHNRRTFDTAVTMYRNEHEAAPTDINDLAPFVSNFNAASVCPGDGTTILRYDAATESVICDFHQ